MIPDRHGIGYGSWSELTNAGEVVHYNPCLFQVGPKSSRELLMLSLGPTLATVNCNIGRGHEGELLFLLQWNSRITNILVKLNVTVSFEDINLLRFLIAVLEMK